LEAVGRRGFATSQLELGAAQPIAEQLGLSALVRTPLRELSGGNQQRVLFGRLLLSGSRVLVLEDPTVGVDIEARQGLHDLLAQLAAEGRTCIVGSGEPEELALLCHRVLIFRDGELVRELKSDEISEQAIISEMTGAVATQEVA
jgi:ABC-type sugar transport system ATPase subunit